MPGTAAELGPLRAALAAAEARAACAEAGLARARVVVPSSEAMIRHLGLETATLRRERCGQGSELGTTMRARLIDQLGLELEELEAAAAEDELAAEKATAQTMAARTTAWLPSSAGARLASRVPGLCRASGW